MKKVQAQEQFINQCSHVVMNFSLRSIFCLGQEGYGAVKLENDTSKCVFCNIPSGGFDVDLIVMFPPLSHE